MHGSEKIEQQRHSRLVDGFDKFVTVEGESLSFMYERLTTLVNVMGQIEIRPLPITINNKFLNSLQPEWSKYVTMTRQNVNLKETKYDHLFDTLSQYEPHVNASRAKKATRNLDPLALEAYSNVYSSHSYASPSYSHLPQPYYVSHPSSIIDYGEDYQGNAQEDKLITTMMLLATEITQRYSTSTNDCLRASSNTRNQGWLPRTELNPRKPSVQCYNCNEKDQYARDCPQPKVHDAKYFKEHMLLAMKDEAGSNLNEEENDFMLDNYYGDDSLEELNAAEELSNDSRDIQATMEEQIKILENNFKRAETQYVNLDLKMQHQKEKIACDVSWKSKMTKLSDENVLLKTQVQSTVQERENIKIEYQKLFNSVKATQVQHQQEVNEVASSSSVSRLESKDTNSKKRVLLNTKSKSTSKDVKKSQSSFNLVADKNDTMNSDMFSLISHDKCVARYALSLNSRIKRALFTSLVAAKSSKLGATSIIAKSRFSVATPPKAINRVSNASPLTLESKQSETLSAWMKNKIRTSRKWQKWFEHQSSFTLSPKSSIAQTKPSVSKSSAIHRTYSRTLVTKKQWVAKLSTLPSGLSSCGAGTVRFSNDNLAAITGYGDYVQGNLTICHVYYVEGLGHNLFSIGHFCDGDLEVAFR
uniref:Integrase, catalytic region, zinc finger, CCHC-type, peptidase aspartic, catalytic n=1 Tax=Tanacetum cinerariifolium TaxID=118510 RepID=A0A6L2N2A4_TANCI|nr:integrase, catalytic region, zinc finger, CCHC-type, peptidase aspartic, catalytic [Tanacetum cinerariifolium]